MENESVDVNCFRANVLAEKCRISNRFKLVVKTYKFSRNKMLTDRLYIVNSSGTYHVNFRNFLYK